MSSAALARRAPRKPFSFVRSLPLVTVLSFAYLLILEGRAGYYEWHQ